MNTYTVTYDILSHGRYHAAKPVTVEARNKKEACATIKNRYYEKLQAIMDKHHWSTRTAMRYVYWPFHIEAERI